MNEMERFNLIISVTLGIISLATVIFYAGYTYRTLQSLRTTAHALNVWRQNLTNDLDTRYIRRDVFDEKFSSMVADIQEIKNNMERRNKSRG